MQSKKKQPVLSVVIPAYNEIKTISEILEKVKAVKIDKEIIVVDDFSTDGTREHLKKIKDKDIKVVLHEKNHGKGMGIRTGIGHATGKIIIIQDADLEYDPEDYHKLIEPILQKKAKVVYGSRFYNGVSFIRLLQNRHLLANRILTVTSNLLYGLKITDEPTCYKVFDAELLKSLNLKSERFEFCPEVTAKVGRKRIEIIELPINYYPRSIKEGKKIRWKDGFEAIWTLVKYKFVD